MKGSGLAVPVGEVDERFYDNRITVGSHGGLRLSLVEVNDEGPSPGGGGHRLGDEAGAPQQNSEDFSAPSAPRGGN
ncbi:hypothetical protein CDL15_Pgr028535 [Punica granatum]|nr:hypothetical protein CDL15_Pgr028535 [Punica granatum]